MIVFPAPKFPKPQYRSARRSKAANRAAERAKKDFLAAARASKQIQRPLEVNVPQEVERILTTSTTPAIDLLALVDDGLMTATEATQALQGTGLNVADVHSAAAFEKDEEQRRVHEEGFENSLESPHGGLLQNLPHDDEDGYDPADELDARDHDDQPHDDTPSLANCDDWGTGEGRYHGRM